jgi:hypothetical protein
MKGYFNYFSKDGPLLNKTVFTQNRYSLATHLQFENRIVYFPTHITKKMFNWFKDENAYLFFADLRGIGKSFSIMLYSELMN